MRVKKIECWEERCDDDVDIYSEDAAESLLDSDSIEVAEYGFMMGYNG